jgi:hypothetical protein
MKIGFQSNQLSMTGTEVALFDYAHHNEVQLCNKSVVLYQASNPNNAAAAIRKFSDRFEVLAYENHEDLERQLLKTGCELLYTIKSGKKDGMVSRNVPTMVHAVFPTSPHQIHGASYAFVSPWLSEKCSRGKIPAVSHIVEMPAAQGDLREALDIPANALVLGGYGGRHSFDVPCAIEAVRTLLESRTDVYFVFMNFVPFVVHPRAIFLPASTDMGEKARFIQTCDAMLHARLQGESFGLAVGEFSVLNKPVLTYRHCKHTHHLNMLGSKGLVYEDVDSLVRLVHALPERLTAETHWDCYSETCNPATVMRELDKHLIQPALSNPDITKPQLSVGMREELAYWKFKLEMRLAKT